MAEAEQELIWITIRHCIEPSKSITCTGPILMDLDFIELEGLQSIILSKPFHIHFHSFSYTKSSKHSSFFFNVIFLASIWQTTLPTYQSAAFRSLCL